MEIGLIITIAIISLFLMAAFIGASIAVKCVDSHPNGNKAAKQYIADFNKSMF